MSKRALKTSVTGAAGEGWIATEPSGQRGAGRLVRLTDAGVDAQSRWRMIEQTALAAWRDMVSAESAEQLRAAAVELVVQLDLEWPHHPVTYGGADPSITGGSYRAGSDGPPRVPAHGQDWKPVTRVADRAVLDELPVDALLSQLLCAFASDYEQHRVGSIAVALMLSRASNESVPVDAFPAEAGVTGEGKSLLERHGLVSLSVDPSTPLRPGHQGNMARPSSTGRSIRDAYRPISDTVEQDWRDRYGAGPIEELRSSLEAVQPCLPSGLPRYFVTTPVRA